MLKAWKEALKLVKLSLYWSLRRVDANKGLDQTSINLSLQISSPFFTYLGFILITFC